MAASVFRRRVGAAAGIYVSVAFGFAGTMVAARLFSSEALGLYAIVLAATSFFQSLLDLTIEEALIKYGFRYLARDDWGRLRRLFRQTVVFKLVGALLAGLALLVLAVFAEPIFGHAELRLPLAIGATIPLLQAPEGISAVALMLRGRYDLRGGFYAVSMALRLAAIAAFASVGLAWTIGAIAVAQGLSSVAISLAGLAAFRRFPRVAHRSLGEDRRGILSFIVQSSGATGMVSLRSSLTPLVLGIVSTATQVGYFRVAMSPQQGFAALSAPIRLVLLTEQTRDWEQRRYARVFAGVRRYTLSAALGAVVLLPFLLWLMPLFVRLLPGPKYLPAVDAARVIVVAGAVQFLVGWSKSFAVTVGRPNLRIWTHGVETIVLLPLAVALGREWGALGAALAVLVSSIVFAAMWTVLLVRIRRETPEPGSDDAERVPVVREVRA